MEKTSIYQVVMDSLAAHVAILDHEGHIVETNRAWQHYGKANGLEEPFDCIGSNYLTICDASSKSPEDDAGRIAQGIRDVIQGNVEEFFTQYPCHSPEERRWYAIRVVPYRDTEVQRVILTHENITPIMEIQEALQEKEEELQRQADKLEETNVALRVLLEQRNNDKQHVEETVYSNINRLALPYLEKLLQSKIGERQKTLVEIVDTNLREIASPFLSQLTSLNSFLTPQEIEVANMVRSGKTSKEIADIMFLSVSGVDFHRKRLRKKLGLTNSKRNLQSYLLSLT